MARTDYENRQNDENDQTLIAQELRDTQRENTELQKRIAHLERSLADTTNQPRADARQTGVTATGPRGRPRLSHELSVDESDQRPARRPRSDSPSEQLNDDEQGPLDGPNSDTIADWGAKFAVVYSLWLVGDEVFTEKMDEHWEPDSRFARKDGYFIRSNLIQGQIREVLEVVPEQHRWYRTDPAFKLAFKHGMQVRRQHFAKRIRTEGTHQIFGDRAAQMRTPESRFAAFAELIGFQGSDGGSKRYTHLAPILGTVPLEEFEKLKLDDTFTNPEAQTLAIGLLRGILAAQAHANHEQSSYKIRGNEIQAKFNIRYTMPGFLANVHVLMRWALSADQALTPVGASTGINWLDDYHDYLCILVTGLDRGTAAIRRVFRSWDKAVFGTVQSFHGGSGADEPELRAQENEDIMQQLDDASQDELESEDD